MKILVLYTRLTGYWMSCMQFDHQDKGNEFLVIRKTPSPEAPFQLASEEGIELINGDKLSLQQIQKISEEFNPDLLYLAGWSDKRYLKVALTYKKRNVPVITGMDNQWMGSMRQHLAGMMSPLLVKKYFTHIWVPGRPQYVFARKLGFTSRHILTGMYCADDRTFRAIAQQEYCRQLTFIGRLVEHKGLKVFFRVLEQLIQENNLHFQVHIIGSGPLEDLIPKHPHIKHTPFVSPDELPYLLKNSGYFVLPSLYEAWGVVVHEAALAGMPIISTHQTGAASEFVIHGHNGYVYDAYREEELKEILLKIKNINAAAYQKMSKASKKLASRISLSSWSATLNSVLE